MTYRVQLECRTERHGLVTINPEVRAGSAAHAISKAEKLWGGTAVKATPLKPS